MSSYFYEDYIKDQDTIIFRHEPYFQTDHILKKKHLIQNWADLLDVNYQGQFPAINFNLVQKQDALKWLREKPLMLIQTNGGPIQNQNSSYSWTRDIPWVLANQIAENFKDQYHIMQITRPGSPILEGVEVVNYVMTNMELFGLVAVSEKRVLIDSSLQHIAAALNLKSTVLWVGTSPNNFGYALHNNLVAFPPKGNVKLIDAYLFDSSFEGIAHECPYSDVTEMFEISGVIDSIKKN
jgi:ADP-heptose:LPS heptosyltransferase